MVKVDEALAFLLATAGVVLIILGDAQNGKWLVLLGAGYLLAKKGKKRLTPT